MADALPQALRASDADRDQAAELVKAAMSDGMLTFAEGDERLGAVYRARYRHELAAVTADLPVSEPARADASLPELLRNVAALLWARYRVAAVVIPLLLFVAMMAAVGVVWAALHDLGGYGYRQQFGGAGHFRH
jgi:hypothetical protein